MATRWPTWINDDEQEMERKLNRLHTEKIKTVKCVTCTLTGYTRLSAPLHTAQHGGRKAGKVQDNAIAIEQEVSMPKLFPERTEDVEDGSARRWLWLTCETKEKKKVSEQLQDGH